jgi:hypothetical protein
LADAAHAIKGDYPERIAERTDVFWGKTQR